MLTAWYFLDGRNQEQMPVAATVVRLAIVTEPHVGFQLVKLGSEKGWKCAIFLEGELKVKVEATDPDHATLAAARAYFGARGE